MQFSRGKGRRERLLWDKQIDFFRKDKWVFRRTNGELKKVCDNVCLGKCEWSFCLLYGHETPQRDFWQPHFPEVAAFNQIRETLRRLLVSASVGFHLLSIQNNPVLRWHILIPFTASVLLQHSYMRSQQERVWHWWMHGVEVDSVWMISGTHLELPPRLSLGHST